PCRGASARSANGVRTTPIGSSVIFRCERLLSFSAMAHEELVSTVKKIVALARDGKLEEAYEAYRALFAAPGFAAYEPADQRQALKLMILAKGVSAKGAPAVVEAHRAAIGP